MVSLKMTAADKILGTVNAPYGANVSAWGLAAAISSMSSVETCNMPAFAFFSEVKPDLQKAFVAEMELDPHAVAAVAAGFQKLAGYDLPLAA